MKLNDKKKAVILYILEKVEQNADSISKIVSENFDINQNTVHKYINELSDEGIIRRIKRGKYELINNKTEYSLKRNKGDLDSETRALDNYIEKYLEFSIPTLEKSAHSIIPGISRETILNTLIPIPPLKEQRRIVDRIKEIY